MTKGTVALVVLLSCLGCDSSSRPENGDAALGADATLGGTAPTSTGSGGLGGTSVVGSTASGVAGSSGSAGSSGATTAGLACAKPVFVTSDTNGGWSDGGYYVHNNMWNSSVQLGPETLSACSYRNWYVVSRQTNEAGAVKTYPNVHKDYDNVAIASFKSITSTFAATSPHLGIYNVAYDIWINGVATKGSTEIMIWTENYKQVPSGSKVAKLTTLDGRGFDVWKTPKSEYIAFVPTAPVTAGSIDLLEIFNWVIAQGWLPATSTLGQICYGVEIVSTDGQDATFTFSDFSIASN